MNRHVNAIAGRLSLRAPQRRSLEILDRLVEIAPPTKDMDLEAALAAIHSEFPTVTDFEREFVSLCFALATGVGKTRLMGAFISYLHLANRLNNFFVLAPNLTIYNKLIADFTPNTSKYVFRGISEFAVSPPIIVTGDNYDHVRDSRTSLFPEMALNVTVNIFNISKINSEVRGGKSARIKRLSEYLGESYFSYLAALPDLVLIMDESHHYRASAGLRAINELKPVLGLEVTATPLVDTSRGAVPFKNVVYDYPLGAAMADGFVKEPAVVTRKDFSPVGMAAAELERIKLEDGIRLHENVKVELETYARETGNPIVKPFLLVIARDITHASQLLSLIQSDEFFDGRYAEKVIQVDSSRTGAEGDEMVERLLKVELTDELTEIVIHVNMLKEGWDVTNLYTIVPLRAASARILIEQSIGRGLRLPYGKRTGVKAVDRLSIVAHDRFQEIVDEASKPGSMIQLQQVVLDPAEIQQRTVTVVSASDVAARLGLPEARQPIASGNNAVSAPEPLFRSSTEQTVARITYDVIRALERQPDIIPGVACLSRPDIQASLVREVTERLPLLLPLDDVPNIAAVVARTTEFVVQQTIDIPRIAVVPRDEVRAGYRPFTLDLGTLNYPAPSDDLWIQMLRTHEKELMSFGQAGVDEARLEDFIVRGLVDFDDVSYDNHADLLYDLASQTVRHFQGYLADEDVRKVLRIHQRMIARLIHAQMQEHYWEDAVDYEVVVSRGFTELKPSAYTASASEAPMNFHESPADKSNMARFLFVGFQRCLYREQKFASDAERKMAIMLDREALKWFKPARGQFALYYRWGAEHPEYQPDFVAETADRIYMIEPKASREMSDGEVLAKRDVAVRWCKHASDHTARHGGKPWSYVLIPHDAIQENMTLTGLADRFTVGRS